MALGSSFSHLGRFRRKIDDAEDGAAARRHDADVDRGTILAAAEIGRRAIRHHNTRDTVCAYAALLVRIGAVRSPPPVPCYRAWVDHAANVCTQSHDCVPFWCSKSF